MGIKLEFDDNGECKIVEEQRSGKQGICFANVSCEHSFHKENEMFCMVVNKHMVDVKDCPERRWVRFEINPGENNTCAGTRTWMKPTQEGQCPHCRGFEFWTSKSGVEVCKICHPKPKQDL